MSNNSHVIAENISYEYSNFKLQNINFEIEKGEIIGFVGKNGSGKTTTIKCITGQLEFKTGSVQIEDVFLKDHPERYKDRVGYVCEDTNIYEELTPIQFSNIFGKFYTKWDNNKYLHLIEIFELDKKKKISQFSKGMKMKFHLAFALSHGADFLVLDEPTSGLDPFIRDEFLNILANESKNNIAILFSTHITEDILKIADKIIFISDGEIKFYLPALKIEESCFRLPKEKVAILSNENYEIIEEFIDEYIIWIDIQKEKQFELTGNEKPLSFNELLGMYNNKWSNI